jgi:hypothetical protein
MTSFAFNTMIGQVTDKAMTAVSYRYYYLFIVCLPPLFPIRKIFELMQLIDLQFHQRTLLLGIPARD